MEPESRQSLARFLALNRTVAIVLLTVLLFGLGEQLWRDFMPVYLDAQTKTVAREASALGAVNPATLLYVGLYAFLLNLFEGFCYIGGGQLTARLGDRGSLLLFAGLTIAGYLLFLTFPGVPAAAIAAALLILGWEPLSVPVTFTTVGSTVARERQGMAFAIQSIQKRLPKMLGPLIAGLVLGYLVRTSADPEEAKAAGFRYLVAGALGLAVVTLLVQLRWMPHRKASPSGPPAAAVVRGFDPALKRLLLAEIFTRWCDWLVREFVVLYVVFVHGLPLEEVGLLIALQHVVALATYLPIGSWTKSAGLRPFIGLTFVFFALFPLTLVLVPTSDWLWLAFVVYGLREIGEPARKALITSLMPEAVRARGVGLYWGIRSFALCTAGLVGALLWMWFSPTVLLVSAFALGCAGAGVWYALSRSVVSEISADLSR